MASSKLPQLQLTVQNINNSRSTVVIKPDKSFAGSLTGKLRPYRNIPKLFKPGLENVADYVRGSMIPETFHKEGPGWAPLARRTVRERIHQGYPGQHPILQRTRDLYQELTQKSHSKHIEIVKVGKEARIEIGGSSKKFIENQMGKRELHLPARPMVPGTGSIPIGERHKQQISRILKKSVERQLGKRI